jgi:hypothetical protein
MKKLKPLLASWGRSFARFAPAMLAGVTDWKALFGAGASAAFPVILRWLNPADVAFGLH